MTLRRRAVALALGLVIIAAAPSARAGEKKTAEAAVALEVRWGADAGSDEFREEMQRAMAERLATACFTSVTIAETPAARTDSDLTLTVLLSNAREDVRFDDSIAGTLAPGAQDQELRRVAHCEVTIEAELSTSTTGVVVIRKRFTTSVARRPLVVGEDPQADARAEVIHSSSRQLSKSLGCGGAKLGRKVRDALGRDDGAPRSR